MDNLRVKGSKFIRPLIYGNTSYFLGSKRESDGHSHSWTVYIKPYYNENINSYIKKVQFKLHESYLNQTREITQPPFQLTETGWGEFEIGITIYFVDSSERSITINHLIKLFSIIPGELPSLESPLVSEFYEELVFVEPHRNFFNILSKLDKDNKYDRESHTKDWPELMTTVANKIDDASIKLASEMDSTKNQLSALKMRKSLFERLLTSQLKSSDILSDTVIMQIIFGQTPVLAPTGDHLQSTVNNQDENKSFVSELGFTLKNVDSMSSSNTIFSQSAQANDNKSEENIIKKKKSSSSRKRLDTSCNSRSIIEDNDSDFYEPSKNKKKSSVNPSGSLNHTITIDSLNLYNSNNDVSFNSDTDNELYQQISKKKVKKNKKKSISLHKDPLKNLFKDQISVKNEEPLAQIKSLNFEDTKDTFN